MNPGGQEEEEARRREEEARRQAAAATSGDTNYNQRPRPDVYRRPDEDRLRFSGGGGSSVAQAWTAPAGGMEFTGGQWNENKGGLAQSDYQGMRRYLRSRGVEPDSGDAGLLAQYQRYAGSGAGAGGGGASGAGAQGGGPSANTDPRAEAFYQELLKRSQQGLAIDRTDPIIRAQADAFAANQERSRRNYLSDVAERQGPLANIQGERRMAAERAGQATGGFEAELIGKELVARRQEISEALQLMGGVLSRDQQAALQRELAQLDAAIRREGLEVQKRGQDIGLDQFLRELAQRQYEYRGYE